MLAAKRAEWYGLPTSKSAPSFHTDDGCLAKFTPRLGSETGLSRKAGLANQKGRRRET